MILKMTVKVSIDLDGANDPAPGDPLESRMMDAAREAVEEALVYTEDNRGYIHEMDDLTAIGFLAISKPVRAYD